MNAEETSRKRRQKGPVPLKKRILKITVITLIAVAAGLAVVFIASQAFLRQEDKIRDAWRVDVGDLLGRDEELQVDLWEAPLEASLSVLQITPAEVSEEGFTYYDEDVQARLEQTVERLKARTSGWSADAPLAILNPYGTGTNGLYLYLAPSGRLRCPTPFMWKTRIFPTSRLKQPMSAAPPGAKPTSSSSSAWSRGR